MLAQKAVEARFGQAKAIERRGVKIAATDLPCRIQCFARRILAHRLIEIAKRRSAKAKGCE